MNLKNLDLEAVRESIQSNGKRAAESVEQAARAWIERIDASVETLRALSGLPSGELLERAMIAEVFPVRLDPGYGFAAGEKCFLRRVEVRTEVQGQSGHYNMPSTYYDFGRGGEGAPLEVGKQYRALVFIVEKKP